MLSLPECAFSDITLASPNATTFTHVEDFKRLKFDYIYHEGPYDKSGPNIANYRQAEVVVPIQCSLDNLKGIVCRSAAEKETLLELLDATTFMEWVDKIAVDNRLFYSHGTYVERANLTQDAVTFTFHVGKNLIFDMSLEIFDFAGNRYRRFVKKQYCLPSVLKLDLSWLTNLETYQVELRLDANLAYKGRYVGEELPF